MRWPPSAVTPTDESTKELRELGKPGRTIQIMTEALDARVVYLELLPRAYPLFPVKDFAFLSLP